MKNENQKKIIALVKTKSNYANLNNQWVTVVQFVGSLIYCEYIDENGEKRRFDLSIKEVESIKETI
jgi:hypothetical protein